MMHEEKARRWESKADDLEPEKQLLVLQADIFLRSADDISIKQMHMRAIADLIRAEGLPRMKPIAAALRQVERQAAGTERYPSSESRRSA